MTNGWSSTNTKQQPVRNAKKNHFHGKLRTKELLTAGYPGKTEK